MQANVTISPWQACITSANNRHAPISSCGAAGSGGGAASVTAETVGSYCVACAMTQAQLLGPLLCLIKCAYLLQRASTAAAAGAAHA